MRSKHTSLGAKQDDRDPVGTSAADDGAGENPEVTRVHKWGYVHLRKPYNAWYARYTVDRPYGRGYDLTRPISLALKGGPEGATKAEAERVALERRPKNLRAQVSKPLAQTLTVRALATGFWEPESDFCVRRAHHSTPCSRVYLDHNKGLMDRYIIAALGPYPLGELAPVIIDDFSILLRDPTYVAMQTPSCPAPVRFYLGSELIRRRPAP